MADHDSGKSADHDERRQTPPGVEDAWQAYRRGEMAECLRLATLATDAHPTFGTAWFVRACAAERSGDMLTADKLFAQASRCVDDRVGTPYRINWRAFQSQVATAIEALPTQLKSALSDVTLILADYAEPELLADMTDAELLGLFTGPVRADRDQVPELSPTIHVFRRAHEHATGTAKEFRDELRRTLYHEFGHYLGFDEGELEQMGMG